jgi:ATP-dependent DNA ligase
MKVSKEFRNVITFTLISYPTTGNSLEGTTQFRIPDPKVHLMAVFFDLLVVDDKNLCFEQYITRTNLLAEIISPQENWVNP